MAAEEDLGTRLHAFLLNGGSTAGLESSLPDSLLKGDYLLHLESVAEAVLSLNEEIEDLPRFLVGVSALQLFVQCNVVGPIPQDGDDSHTRLSSIVSRMRIGASVDSNTSTSPRLLLNLDGESAYPLVLFPHLLLFAKTAFSSSSSVPSAPWWRLRADSMHQRTLQEPVETLRSSIVDELVPLILASPFFRLLSTPHRALFHLEAYHAMHYYSRAKDAAKMLDSAVKLAGVDLR